MPAENYVILVTAKNNNSSAPRIMRDDVMGRIKIITKSEARTVNITENSNAMKLLATTILLIIAII